MALINTLNKASGQVLKTYKARNGNITYLLESEIPGRGIGKRIANCDRLGNPQKIIDYVPNLKKDVYEKATDGSTILNVGNKKTNLPNLIFNSIWERFFK